MDRSREVDARFQIGLEGIEDAESQVELTIYSGRYLRDMGKCEILRVLNLGILAQRRKGAELGCGEKQLRTSYMNTQSPYSS